MAASDAFPVPIKNTAYRVTFPMYDNDGDLVTSGGGLDSEVSKDGGTFTDCTNEATEIATTSGIYYLELTSTEMNADTVAIKVSSTNSDSKDSVIILYPQEAGDIKVDVETISQDADAAIALESQYDGTGLTGDTYPATQSQLGNISSGTAAINTVSESYNLTTGSQTSGTYVSTQQLDLTYHIIEDAAGNTEFYYQFDIGSTGVPVAALWDGYVQSVGDSAAIYAYNWAGTSWDQIGSRSGAAGTTRVNETWSLTTAHVGTGANVGKVRIRFLSTDATAIATDRILCSYSTVVQTVGYSNGAIWVDTNASNTNTTDYVDGTADNPVSTWAAALTLSASLGIKKFEIANGSAITLSASSDNYTLTGSGWTLALASQSIDSMSTVGATVTGIGEATTTRPRFSGCIFGAATVPPAVLDRCGIGNASGTFTAASAGQYVLDHCYSVVPGSGSPAMVFSGLGSTTGINCRGWLGGATYTLDSDCTLSHEVLAGGGTTITSAGADVEIRGTTRSVTLTCNGTETVQFVGVTGPITLNGTTTATFNLYGVSSAVTDNTSAATVNDYTLKGPSLDAVLVDTGTTLPGTLTTIEGKIDTIDTNVDAILVDTGTTLDGKIDTIDGIVDAILVDTGTTLPAQISGLNNLSAADVNAQVVDVIRTDTASELAAVPAASPALHTMIQWMYMIHRNELTSTATASTVSNDAGTTIGTSTDSDDSTTFTRGEFA